MINETGTKISHPNLMTLPLVIPIHGIYALLCLRDPRIFDLLLLRGRTRRPRLRGNVSVLAGEQLRGAHARSVGSSRAQSLPGHPAMRVFLWREGGYGGGPMSAAARRPAAVPQEPTVARHILYSAHVSETVVKTFVGDYVQTCRLGGVDYPGLRLEEVRRGRAVGALEAGGLVLFRFAAPALELCCSASRTASAVAGLRPYIGRILMPR